MIKEEMVFIGVELDEKEEVISFVAEKAKALGFINDVEAYKEAVLEREAEISTSVGHYIAIPHGKVDAVKEPFVAYIKSKKPFQWDEETKDMVHSIFMIGVPCNTEGDKTHLRYISEVSKKLMNDTFREQLFKCQERGQAYQLLSLINQEL